MRTATRNDLLRLGNVCRLWHTVAVTTLAVLLEQVFSVRRAGRIDDVGRQRIDLSLAQFLAPRRHVKVPSTLADHLAQFVASAGKGDGGTVAGGAIGFK